MALSEANQLKATAELEAQLSVLRPKAEAAEALEKDVRRLQEQLSASEELRAAHEALKKETNALKEQLKELQSKSGQPVKPVDTKAAGKGQSLADGELQALLRERDELRERVRALEKNMAAASGTTMQGDTVHPTGKEAPAQRGSGGALPAKKPLPPLPKREHAASAEPAAAEFPAGEKGDETSPEETVVGLLPPVAAKAVDAQEPRATEPATGSEGLPPKKLEPSVGKTAPSLKAGEEPHTGQKGEEAGGSYKTLPKSAKKPPPPPHKPAEKDTKVPPPPKKAPPVEAPSGDLVELTSEVKGNLEKEIASLREQLAAAEELKTTHEALQREFIALQGELKSLKAQAKASESEEKVETGEPAEPQPQETELLRKERNTLRERVAALEAELSNLRASEAHGVAIPKTKGTLPPKLRPGKSPLPAKAPKQADAKAYAQTSGRAGERKDESRLSSTETEVGDSGAESSPAEERVAELTERLQRAKRRVRNLVIKCNALVELEKERDALRSQLESLQAKHEAISKLHEKEAKDKLAVAGADKAEADSMLKSASAAALSASAVASTVADDPEGVATMNRSLTTQSSSALLDVQPPADWAEKYEKVKAQRDKVYQAYKAQKERITSLEEEEAITKERLERVERLYQETKEELEIVTRPPKQREGAESAGILSWLGGGAHDEKPPEEQKLRARLELLQQRLQKALAENEALSSKLAQMRSPRGDSAAGGEATTEQSQGRPSQHLSPHTVSKGAGSEALSAKDPSATHPGPVRGEDSEAERKSLTELQQQVKQKDAQIEKYKAEILKLKASAVPVSGESSVAAELAKKEQELQAKTAELEKVTKDASDKEALIREKTEEVKTLKARLEALEKEKRQALDDNSALKKELETLQKELEGGKLSTTTAP
ncbi:LOW QUALITY PROTEIN: uncharacterized protein EMH_0002420 [Eimeria mitis]|uniref:Uncharacterized protein n=1 Tax=Eimeria mitis TaxID=44415 RepID=U6JZE2_9EIME|nr:LOW QUALITY PROTEIN: uncharacterized protein EMH_0002420 [Eimeria mitis]CDJ28868.1 hypothetical protein EMH_0002420 [Eimeria mitis]